MCAIDSFEGKHRFLSNFWPCTIKHEGKLYASVEHAYQASKTIDPVLRDKFSCKPITPGQAKRLGKQLPLRPEWDKIKFQIMLDLLREKFSDRELRVRLLDTGDRELIEKNAWGDSCWGVCNDVGENNLGKLLMLVRKELNGEYKIC
jgi:ribA/ribD-fused uncharacterized protein